MTPDVVKSEHREEIIAEVQGLAFQRLAEIGYEPAAVRLLAEQEIAVPSAVARVFTEALAGNVTTGAWTDLHRADPEAYREIQTAEIPGVAEDVQRFGIQAEREIGGDRFDAR